MGIYTESFTIRYTDVDRFNRLTLKSLITYFQEIAGRHSEIAGYGVNDIPNTHVTWLLLNWKVKMFSHPHVSDRITIKTWAKPFDKFYSNRDFEVFDTNGNIVAIATSKWILINTDTKKISRITENISNAYGILDRHVFNEETNFDAKICLDNSILNFNYKVQRRDIDTNGHVNNLHYIDYAFESLPEEIYNNIEFNNIEILYKKEIKYPNIIHCYYSFINDEHIIFIKSSDDSILHSIIKLY